MIEEYARHNGHADLLRERIDGRVGQLCTRQIQTWPFSFYGFRAGA